MSAIIDYLWLTVYFIFLFVAIVIGFIIWTNINTGLDDALGGDPENQLALDLVQNYEDRMPVYYDWTLVLVLFLIWFGVVLGVYLLDNLPIFMIFFLILAVLGFFITLPLVNLVYSLSLDTDFQQYFDAFPTTMFFITNWIFVLVFFMVSIVGAYIMKSQRGENFA